MRSIETFERIRKLAADIGVKNVWCVANRVSGEEERSFIASHVPEEDLLGEIPFSMQIIKNSRGQAALTDAEPPVWEAVDGILATIRQRVEDH